MVGSSSIRRFLDCGHRFGRVWGALFQPVFHVGDWSCAGASRGRRVIGSTIGSRVGKYLPAKVMEKGLGVVFGSVGILVLVLEFIV